MKGKRGWLRDRAHTPSYGYSIDEEGNVDTYDIEGKCWIRPMMSISLEGLEPVENVSLMDCYTEETPFSGKYWVIYRNGNQNERIEATSVDSTHTPEMLCVILEDYELILNDDNGIDNWNGYIFSDSGQWIENGHPWPLADKTRTIIASNLDVYDAEGNLILEKSKYSDINWESIY